MRIAVVAVRLCQALIGSDRGVALQEVASGVGPVGALQECPDAKRARKPPGDSSEAAKFDEAKVGTPFWIEADRDVQPIRRKRFR